MVYVYAITDSPSVAVDDQPGLAGKPLEVLACESIGAVYSAHEPPTTISPTAENVWRHEQVVEWVMREHAVLPARFGTRFNDAVKLKALLASHHGDLAAGLRRVAGCVELGLRVLWQGAIDEAPAEASRTSGDALEGPQPPIAGAPGRAYMAARLVEERRRRDERQRAQRLADELHAPLSAAAAESTCRVLAAPQLLLTAAYLVRREGTGAFRTSVERLGASHPDLRLLCTGPWPPYHFVPSVVGPAEAFGD